MIYTSEPTYSLATVQDFMDLSRRTINSLMEERDSAVYQREKSDDMQRSMTELAHKYQTELEEKDAKIKKLRGVIDALKLELANEREAHTKCREHQEPPA